MENTRSEKRSYRVLLLLVVGLAAFSSAMKELNQVHALTLQTSSLLAQWSDRLVPADNSRVETCENQIPLLPPPPPMPELQSLPPVPPPAEPSQLDDVEELGSPSVITPEVAPLPPAPPRVRELPTVKPRRVVRLNHDSAEVRVFSTDELLEKSIKDAFVADPSLKALKAKHRRQIWITPEGKDVILKTLNRSINLRSAS